MANNIQPGCARSPSGRYLPVVFEAHGRVFFSGASCTTPEAAVEYALQHIANMSYQYWHYHEMGDNNA